MLGGIWQCCWRTGHTGGELLPFGVLRFPLSGAASEATSRVTHGCWRNGNTTRTATRGETGGMAWD